MGSASRGAIRLTAVLTMLLLCNRPGLADDAMDPTAVHVKYASGSTVVDTLRPGAKSFSNRKYTYDNLPDELNGLMFTRRAGNDPADVTIKVPGHAAVYVLVDDDKGKNAKQKGVQELNQLLVTSGWARIANSKDAPAIYKFDFPEPTQLTLPGAGFTGVVVIAKNLTLDTGDTKADKKPDPSPPASTLHKDVSTGDTPSEGATTRPALQQASIKALEIYETDTGLMLGQTSEVTLTITRGNKSKSTGVTFVTRIGDQMSLTRDEALRFIHLTYPNWYVDKAEITFEDKYVAHDGGSIGAAVGTMILSVIQGFGIDDAVAITGDISANGKVRAIGGLSAKIRGAAASKCTLVAVPSENEGQLVDAVTYSGPAIVTDVQVIGISNLSDAIATVRTDRDAKLTQAIALFAEIQQSIKESPTYLTKTDSQVKLKKVLELAPQHLSARILLAVAQNKQPTTLSPTASRYYTFLAARSMTDVLKERADSTAVHQIPSAAVRSGLADLKKLRPLADTQVKPLIDAWSRFIGAWSEMQQGIGSPRTVERQRQSLIDEMAKEDADAGLMQKMLKEGM